MKKERNRRFCSRFEMLGMSLSILLIIIYLCSKIHTFCPYILSDSSFKCYFALYEFLTFISFNNFISFTFSSPLYGIYRVLFVLEPLTLLVKGCKFWPMLGTWASDQWGFSSVTHLLWHGPTVWISMDPWHSHRLPSIWQWNCHCHYDLDE